MVSIDRSKKAARIEGGRLDGKLAVLTAGLEEDGDDHTVHTEDTSHDDGDDRSEEKLGLEDSHGDDTDA
jgi:hypothetical protein